MEPKGQGTPGSLAVAAAAAVLLVGTGPARAGGGELRVGMTAADIPLSWGQPDQGFEGTVRLRTCAGRKSA